MNSEIIPNSFIFCSICKCQLRPHNFSFIPLSPEQQQGSEAGSCLSAAAEELQCAALSAAVELHTFAEGTEQLSWRGDAMPVELPVISQLNQCQTIILTIK